MRKAWHKLTAGGLPAGFRPIGGGEQSTELKSRLDELRTAAKKLIDENQTIVASAKTGETEVDGEKVPVTIIDVERRTRFDENMKQVREELQPEIKRIEEMLELAEWGERPARASAADTAAAHLEALKAAGLTVQGPSGLFEGKTLGQIVLESEEWKAFKESGQVKKSMTYDVGSLARKDVYSDLPTGTPGSFGRVQRDPLVPMAFRTFRVRDLFNPVNTDAALIEFFRVTGFNNAASMVPERDGSAFALKPHSNLSVEGAQAPVRTIAHWEVAHRNVLDDEPQLRGIIENELLYGLQLTEDYQILQGTGTGQDLLGLLNTPNIQAIAQGTSPSSGDDNAIDVVRRAMTLAFLANYEATGVVTDPVTWQDMELGRDKEGRYLIYAVAGMPGAQPTVWRLPVVTTPAMPDATALVGAFGLGATLYDRQASNIRIAEQHDDYFVRNAVVILAEERLALACKRPESFVKCTNLSTEQQPT